ncbi:MAG: hypothetical protein JWM59_4972 [Verrucomicrobiales bacterium]|nr:hypothetical protein [Verrucomicrobiales bacterium]
MTHSDPPLHPPVGPVLARFPAITAFPVSITDS